MRRFLTLVCLLGLALPAGISISGCTRNPGAKTCNGLGYGPLVTQVASITLQPQITGISLAYGQTTQVQAPQAFTCKDTPATVSSSSFSYGTSNNQLVDISPSGSICAGTWNRNTGGGIADYTYCNFPNPAPATGGLPYAVSYIYATADSVTSNPVAVYIHAPISSINLVTTPLPGTSAQGCFSQNQQASLDAQACYAGLNSSGVATQFELCAPPTVTGNFACTGGALPKPNIIAGAGFTAPVDGPNGSVSGALYLSGGTITGTIGQTCNVSGFNNGAAGATATLQTSAINTTANGTALTIAGGTPLVITSGGAGATAPPTQATLSNGSATCSGTIQIGQIYGSSGQYCYLTNFNNGSAGATGIATLNGTNAITSGSPIDITAGGTGAAAPPTQALMTSGTATCAGLASVNTVLTPVPSCESSIGTLNFQVGTSAVASIDSTNNVITAEQPGTTAITATIAQSSSSAGYFSTCPPASIHVALANGSTKGAVTQGVAQNLTTTVYDTNESACPPNGCSITGLSLTYQSTNPIDITAGSGAITAAFPGSASIYATCEPPGCNPAPINEIGLYGTGLPLASNPVDLVVPGTASDFAWFGAPGQSQYFSSIELITGAPGSTVRLPYVPNSMLMDQGANNLYFGSQRELMIYSTGSNTLTKQDPTVPGIVLAVSPNNDQILINDQARGLFYLYNVSAGTALTQGGLAACNESSPAPCKAAAWTPDSNTVYIVDSAALGGNHTDTLYVYNNNTGWSSSKLACSTSNTSPAVCDSSLGTNQPDGAQNLAVTVPGIGTYLSGDPTVARTWCPSGTVGNNASILFYPQPATDSINVPTSILGATLDGAHMLGAALSGSGINLTDIGLNIPPNTAYPSAECPIAVSGTTQTLSPLSTNPVLNGTVSLTGVTGATAVNQVVTGEAPTTASVNTAAPIAFVTYDTPAASTVAVQLPYYLPQASGVGQPNYVTFCQDLAKPNCSTGTSATSPTAPLFGAFSPDNTIFFVSTQGDNAIHFITIPPNLGPSAPPTDTQQFSPNLPACTPVSAGGSDAGCDYPTAPAPNAVVPATAVTVKPRSVT
jgi:trimeric autotransporter adhesin